MVLFSCAYETNFRRVNLWWRPGEITSTSAVIRSTSSVKISTFRNATSKSESQTTKTPLFHPLSCMLFSNKTRPPCLDAVFAMK